MAFRTSGSERMRITSDGKVGVHTTSPNVGSANAERGVLTISSTDSAGANNYGVLEIQGHSISNDGALAVISFLDHTSNNATIQVNRQNNSGSAKMMFSTSESGGSQQVRLTINDNGHSYHNGKR